MPQPQQRPLPPCRCRIHARTVINSVPPGAPRKVETGRGIPVVPGLAASDPEPRSVNLDRCYAHLGRGFGVLELATSGLDETEAVAKQLTDEVG